MDSSQGLRKRPLCKYYKKIFNQAPLPLFIWEGEWDKQSTDTLVVVLQSWHNCYAYTNRVCKNQYLKFLSLNFCGHHNFPFLDEKVCTCKHNACKHTDSQYKVVLLQDYIPNFMNRSEISIAVLSGNILSLNINDSQNWDFFFRMASSAQEPETTAANMCPCQGDILYVIRWQKKRWWPQSLSEDWEGQEFNLGLLYLWLSLLYDTKCHYLSHF